MFWRNCNFVCSDRVVLFWGNRYCVHVVIGAILEEKILCTCGVVESVEELKF